MADSSQHIARSPVQAVSLCVRSTGKKALDFVPKNTVLQIKLTDMARFRLRVDDVQAKGALVQGEGHGGGLFCWH